MLFNYNLSVLKDKMSELYELYESLSHCEEIQSMEQLINQNLRGEEQFIPDITESPIKSLEQKTNSLVQNLNYLFENNSSPESHQILFDMEQVVSRIESKRKEIFTKLQQIEAYEQHRKLLRWALPETSERKRARNLQSHFSLEIQNKYQEGSSLKLKEIAKKKTLRFQKERVNKLLGIRKYSRSPSPMNKLQEECERDHLSSYPLSKRYFEDQTQNFLYSLEIKKIMLISLKESLSGVFQETIKDKSPEEALAIVKNYAKRQDILVDPEQLYIEEGELKNEKIEVRESAVQKFIANDLEHSGLDLSLKESVVWRNFISQTGQGQEFNNHLKVKIEEDYFEFLQRRSYHSGEEYFNRLYQFYMEEMPILREYVLTQNLPENIHCDLMSGGLDSLIEKFLLEQGSHFKEKKECLNEIYKAKCKIAVDGLIALQGKNDPISKTIRRRHRDMLEDIPIENFPFRLFLEISHSLLCSYDQHTQIFVQKILKNRMDSLYEEVKRNKKNEKRLLEMCDRFIYASSLLSEETHSRLFPSIGEKYLQASKAIAVEDIIWQASKSVPDIPPLEQAPVEMDLKLFLQTLQKHRNESLKQAIQKFKRSKQERKKGIKGLLRQLFREEASYIKEMKALHPVPLESSFLILKSMENFAQEIQEHFSIPRHFLDEILDEITPAIFIIKEEFQLDGKNFEQCKKNLNFTSRSMKALETAMLDKGISEEDLPLFLEANSQCIRERCNFEQKSIQTVSQLRSIECYMRYKQKIESFQEMDTEKLPLQVKEILEKETAALHQEDVSSRKMQQETVEITEQIYMGEKSLNREEVESLILFQRALEGKKLTEDDNEKLQKFFSLIAQNKSFNQRVGSLIRSEQEGIIERFFEEPDEVELFKYGVSKKALKSVRYLSFKMKTLDDFSRSLEKAEALLSKLSLRNQESTPSFEEKLSFREYTNVLSLKKIVKCFKRIQESGFQSSELEELSLLAEKSRRLIAQFNELLHENLSQELKTGDFLMDSNEKKTRFTGSQRKISELVWDKIFSYTHASLALQKRGKINASEIYGKYVMGKISLEDIVKKDLWKFDFKQLPFNLDFLASFQGKYPNWEEKLQEDFEIFIHQLHSPSEEGEENDMFPTLENSWEIRRDAGLAKIKGTSQEQANDFQSICQEMHEFRTKNKDEGEDKMFCSEFVARITLSALFMMQEKYREEFNIPIETKAFEMPFPEFRNIKTVDPGSLIGIFQKNELLVKRQTPPILRDIFQEFS